MPFIPDKIQANQGGFKPDDSLENKAVVESHSLLARFGKKFYNAFLAEGVGGTLTSALSGYTPGMYNPPGSLSKKIGGAVTEKLATEVPQAETTGEKAVDVGAGIGAFVAQLAVLKKIVPAGTSEKTLWELQNLMTGGTPGQGALMHSVFGIPGKVIPGTSKGAKVGRLALESGLLGGASAINQKLTTGEIDWKEVAVNAGIPVALHSLGYVQHRIAKGDPKVLKAVEEVENKAPEVKPTKKIKIDETTPITKEERLQLQSLGMSLEEIGKTPIKTLRESIVSSKAPERLIEAQTPINRPATAKEIKDVVFVRNKAYDNSMTVRKLPQKGVSAWAVKKNELPEFWKKIKAQGLDKRDWEIVDVKGKVLTAINHYDAGLYAQGVDVDVTGERFNPTKHINTDYEIRIQSPKVFGETMPDVTKPENIVYRAGKIKEGMLHFGTEEAATKAATGRKINQYQLDIKNPASLIDSGRAHDKLPSALIEDLIAGNNKGLVKELIPVVKHIEKDQGIKAAFDAIKAALENHGYDGIKYTNVNEAPGSVSYITLKPNQAKLVKTKPVITKPETITSAATRIKKTGEIFTGPIHFDSTVKAMESAKIPDTAKGFPRIAKELEDGFVTSTGRFVTAEEALKIAQVAKQKSPKDIDTGAESYNFPEKSILEQPENTNTAIDKLQTWSKKAEKLNKIERKLAVRQLHKQQFAGGTRAKEQALKEGVSPSERLRRISRGFGGKAKIPELKPPKLSEAEWDSISLKAEEVYGKDVFKLKEIQTDLDNLKNFGKIPGDRGLGLLEPVLGIETIYKLHETALKQREFSPWDIPDIAISGLKSPFGFDPQAARQLAPIAVRHPLVYLDAVWTNIRGYLNKDYAKVATETMESDPMFEFAKKKMGLNVLGLKPWKVSQKGQTRLQQFGDFTEWLRRRDNKLLKTWGNVLAASERGANLGIDKGMLRLAKLKGKQLEKILSKRTLTQKQIDKFWLDAGKDINAFTKRVVANHPSARKIQKSANYILFSPAYTASYPYRTWRVLKELFNGSPGNRTTGIQYVLSQVAALTALSSIPAYVAHKYRANDPSKEPPVDSSVNPMESLWGHFRVGNNVYDFTFGEGSYYRLLARIGVSAYLNAQDLTTGKQTTRIGGRPVPKVGEELKRYLTSRETVALGLLKTLATGKDWMGEPIDTTWIVNQMMPMSALKDLVDAGHADGLWESMVNGDISTISKSLLKDMPTAMSGAFGAGVTSYKTNPSVTRANFRNITAQRVYNTSWDNLSKGQQARLRFQNRNTFKDLDRAVKEYRVQHPYNVERIQEEERNAGKRISKLLTPQNRELVKGVSLALNRSPQNLYLNDERYNRYQELVAQILNEKLPKVLEVKDLNRRQKRVELLLSMAKKRAFFMLRREQ